MRRGRFASTLLSAGKGTYPFDSIDNSFTYIFAQKFVDDRLDELEPAWPIRCTAPPPLPLGGGMAATAAKSIGYQAGLRVRRRRVNFP